MLSNLISAQYVVVQFIKRTEHSELYLVKHIILEEIRIAKIVSRKTEICNVLIQAKLLKDLKHKGIPVIYDIIADENSICIIEEYIYGKSLTEYVNESKKLDISKICAISIELCNILEYLHTYKGRGILYLDLKPEHVIIDAQNQVHLIDYDNSHYADSNLKRCYGSVGFAAPEQYHSLTLDVTADIYSLGMLILYMSTGGQHLYSKKDTCHKKLYPIIKKCLKHKSFQRYKSVQAIKRDLYNIMSGSKQKNKLNARNIFVFGTKHNAGTTHLSLCIASYLKRHGFKVVCIIHSDPEDLRTEINRAEMTKDGFYYLNGIYLLPFYGQYVDADIELFDFCVYDCAVPKCANDISSYTNEENAIRVLVHSNSYRILDDNKLNDYICNSDYVFINHISGKRMYELLRKSCLKSYSGHFFRMPCIYDWSCPNSFLDAEIKQMLS